MVASSHSFQKNDNPQSVNDYKHVSLLNSAMKLLAEIIANRLKSVILSVVHASQYGFVKGRTIQDFLSWAYHPLSVSEIKERNSHSRA